MNASSIVNVVFRTDASSIIGTGHVMRCLTLAGALRDSGAEVVFVCREHEGNLCDRIVERGFSVSRLPNRKSRAGRGSTLLHADWLGVPYQEDAAETRTVIQGLGQRPHWLIADHYAIDARWEQSLRGSVSRLMVIDDLADRSHDCDLLLDQNFYQDAATRYDNLVATSSRRLLGPTYALLRPEFTVVARSLAKVSVPRLFVSVGGVDPYGVCDRVVTALGVLGCNAPGADIVAGDSRSAVAESAACLNDVEVHGFVDNIAALMSRCSLAVGAGGSSTWERCAQGLPSLVVIVAENQRRMVEDLAQAGVIVNLGPAAEIGVEQLADAIYTLLNDGPRRDRLRQAGMDLVDCKGASRVAEEIRRLSCTA